MDSGSWRLPGKHDAPPVIKGRDLMTLLPSMGFEIVFTKG